MLPAATRRPSGETASRPKRCGDSPGRWKTVLRRRPVEALDGHDVALVLGGQVDARAVGRERARGPPAVERRQRPAVLEVPDLSLPVLGDLEEVAGVLRDAQAGDLPASRRDARATVAVGQIPRPDSAVLVARDDPPAPGREGHRRGPPRRLGVPLQPDRLGGPPVHPPEAQVSGRGAGGEPAVVVGEGHLVDLARDVELLGRVAPRGVGRVEQVHLPPDRHGDPSRGGEAQGVDGGFEGPGEQRLGGQPVPDGEPADVVARGHDPAVGREPAAGHHAARPVEDGQHAAGRVVEPDHAVLLGQRQREAPGLRGAGQAVADLRERPGLDLRLAKLEQPAAAVHIKHGQVRAVVQERHAVDAALVGRPGGDRDIPGQVPDPEPARPVAAGEPAAVGAQGQAGHADHVVRQRAEHRPVGRPPDLDRRVLGAGDHPAAVGSEGDRRDGAGVAPLKEQFPLRLAHPPDLRRPEVERRVDPAEHPEPLLGQRAILVQAVEAGQQVARPLGGAERHQQRADEGAQLAHGRRLDGGPAVGGHPGGHAWPPGQLLEHGRRRRPEVGRAIDPTSPAHQRRVEPADDRVAARRRDRVDCLVEQPSRLPQPLDLRVDWQQIRPRGTHRRLVGLRRHRNGLTREEDDDDVVRPEPGGQPPLERPVEVGSGRQQVVGRAAGRVGAWPAHLVHHQDVAARPTRRSSRTTCPRRGRRERPRDRAGSPRPYTCRSQSRSPRPAGSSGRAAFGPGLARSAWTGWSDATGGCRSGPLQQPGPSPPAP